MEIFQILHNFYYIAKTMLNEAGQTGQDLVTEDLFTIDFYLGAMNDASSNNFQTKLDKKTINKTELKYGKFSGIKDFFGENNLGALDKIKVAKKINGIVDDDKADDEKTISTFSNFFKLINERLKISVK